MESIFPFNNILMPGVFLSWKFYVGSLPPADLSHLCPWPGTLAFLNDWRHCFANRNLFHPGKWVMHLTSVLVSFLLLEQSAWAHQPIAEESVMSVRGFEVFSPRLIGLIILGRGQDSKSQQECMSERSYLIQRGAGCLCLTVPFKDTPPIRSPT